MGWIEYYSDIAWLFNQTKNKCWSIHVSGGFEHHILFDTKCIIVE